MTLSSYKIDVKSLKDVIYLVMFSDLHWDSPQFCDDEWREFLYWAKHHRNAYFVGNGDYQDTFRATTRDNIQRFAEPEELGMIEETSLRHTQKLADQMKPLKGRLLGLGDGNHGWRFRDGRWDSEVLAQMMGCKFLGVKSIVNVQLCCQGQYTSFLYYQHHGRSGNTSTAGGPFNAVEKQGRHFDSVQVVAQGDDHNKGILRGKPRLRVVPSKSGDLLIKEYTPFYVRTGSFRKGFVPDTVDYAHEANYGPVSLGAPVLQMKMYKTQEDGLRLKMGEHSMI